MISSAACASQRSASSARPACATFVASLRCSVWATRALALPTWRAAGLGGTRTACGASPAASPPNVRCTARGRCPSGSRCRAAPTARGTPTRARSRGAPRRLRRLVDRAHPVVGGERMSVRQARPALRIADHGRRRALHGGRPDDQSAALRRAPEASSPSTSAASSPSQSDRTSRLCAPASGAGRAPRCSHRRSVGHADDLPHTAVVRVHLRQHATFHDGGRRHEVRVVAHVGPCEPRASTAAMSVPRSAKDATHDAMIVRRAAIFSSTLAPGGRPSASPCARTWSARACVRRPRSGAAHRGRPTRSPGCRPAPRWGRARRRRGRRCEHGLEHRDVDVLAVPGHVTVVQRAEQADGGVERSDVVGQEIERSTTGASGPARRRSRPDSAWITGRRRGGRPTTRCARIPTPTP